MLVPANSGEGSHKHSVSVPVADGRSLAVAGGPAAEGEAESRYSVRYSAP